MLRGLALPGIALMNIEWFTRPIAELGDGVPADAAGWDYTTGWLIFVLVQGKFWLLFALLFGAGVTLMRQRMLAAGRSWWGPLLRRAAVMFVFGIAHALLLWPGDILHTYAIAAVGMLLLAPLTEADPVTAPTLRGVIGGTLFLLFTGWLSLVSLIVAVGSGFGGDALSLETLRGADPDALAQAAAVYAEGDWLAVTAQRGRDFLTVLGQDVFLLPVALGVFLIGSWLLDSGRLLRPAQFPRFFRACAFVLLPLGLLLTVAGSWRATGMNDAPDAGAAMFAQWAHWVGSLPMTLGYVALVVMAMQRPAIAGWLARWLAPAGRMALTNYLMASAVFGTLFYGYGFGLWGQVSRPGQVGLVLALTLAQCLLSAWWLARFRYGPLEWLWRAATWLQRPGFRRRPA